MARSVFIPRHGDVSVLEVRDGPPAALRPGTVRIRVSAIGVNFADVMMRMGLYPQAPKPPFVPGYEVAGTVVESAGDDGPAPGSRVWAVTRFGGYTEDLIAPAGKVHPLPENWSFEEGAAFPVAYLTAWMGLQEMARIREGDQVLVYGAAGGVGLAAVQIARAVGARVLGTCGGANKAQAVLEHGAEKAVNYKQEKIEDVASAWAPGGIDVAFDARGGGAMRRGLALLKPGGRLVAYGMSEAITGQKRNLFATAVTSLSFLRINLLQLVQNNWGVFGLDVLRLWDRDDLLPRVMVPLNTGIKTGSFRATVDTTFPMEQAGEAHRYLHERKNIGKVVLTTGV